MALVTALAAAGKRVLIASYTNAAVDTVLLKVRRLEKRRVLSIRGSETLLPCPFADLHFLTSRLPLSSPRGWIGQLIAGGVDVLRICGRSESGQAAVHSDVLPSCLGSERWPASTVAELAVRRISFCA